MQIIDLKGGDQELILQAAEILTLAFRENNPDAWPTMEDALDEIHEMTGEENFMRVAVDGSGRVLGLIGGIREYDGHVWELHPLAVHPDEQGNGIGRALVEDFEERIRQLGGGTIMLGTDDENFMTSLSQIDDLYPELWEAVRSIRNLKNHPFTFYEKMGFTIVGIIPDANGPRKPDILMAKRVKR